jgi:hypothetical protein
MAGLLILKNPFSAISGMPTTPNAYKKKSFFIYYHERSSLKLSKCTNSSESKLLFRPVPVIFSSRQPARTGNRYTFFSLSSDSHTFIFI